jgi:hypothetical protein
MLFGELRITAADLAEKLISNVLKEMGRDGDNLPHSGGKRRKWTKKVQDVLKKLGEKLGYKHTYPWLVDLIWWDMESQSLAMAVECEWSPPMKGEEDDFEKLTVFKCPLKLFVFSTRDAQEIKRMAQRYLKLRTQHVKDEEYLLIGFTPTGPRCFWFKVPFNGKLKRVHFSELPLRASART